MLCGPLNNIPLGYQSGQISLQILEAYPADALKCKIHMLFNSFVGHWQETHSRSIKTLEQTVQMGMETGDVVYAAYCAMWSCGYMMLVGMKLPDVAEAQQIYLELLEKTKQDHGWYPAKTWRQLTENLQGQASNPLTLRGNYLKPADVEHLEADQNQMLLFFVYFAEVILAYVMKDWPTAKAKMAIASQYQAAATASMLSGGYIFYETLVQLAIYSELSASEQTTLWEQIQQQVEILENWVQHAPQNYQSKYELVLAEKCRIQGDVLEAMEYYDRAIATAQSNGFLAESAIAAERCADFYRHLGREKIAQQYLLDALYHYDIWGAPAKTTLLQAEFPQLSSIASPQLQSSMPESIHISLPQNHQTNTNLYGGEILDFKTVIKAAQTLSSEIILSQLLSQLMNLAIKNAGAQMGCLLLMEDGQLTIAASGQLDATTGLDLAIDRPINPETPLPLSLIQYVQRTQENVVLSHAVATGLFMKDPYIVAHQTKSVISVPILQQKKFLGLLYLENNLAIGAFTSDRLEVLKIISSQAAISIQNARLYSRLEDYSHNLEVKVEQRTQALRANNQQLQQTLKKLQQTQAQLIQTEKMSSLGQMVAGIAHEINNPITFIAGNINHAREYVEDLLDLLDLYEDNAPESEIEDKVEEIELEYLREDLKQLFNSMKNGSDRIRKIVLGLRNFSRLDESEMKPVDIHEGLENTLMILQHRLNQSTPGGTIQVQKNYGQLPAVNCYANQLNQVFLHILTNAIDVLSTAKSSSSPEIRITTEMLNQQTVQISIADNGSGMSEEVRQKVFDPFFTTKSVGQGTGLGLTTSYQIITEQHRGQLDCISQPGQGTEFMIKIPV